MSSRNYDEKYRQWRKKVYARDGHKCKMPGCKGTSKALQAHHIKLWAHFPELRYVVSNGITLCRVCHEEINGKEEDYESLFLQLITNNIGLMFLKFK